MLSLYNFNKKFNIFTCYPEIDGAAEETSTQNELGGREKGHEASSYPQQSAHSTTEYPSGYPPNRILVVGDEYTKKIQPFSDTPWEIKM
ncbi:hypothetical protein JTB14_023108 [Gonioctena quinquepunctata]|nr:hypothetical protein JTB14_023108 [Gonioctena quinquepunctata]